MCFLDGTPLGANLAIQYGPVAGNSVIVLTRMRRKTVRLDDGFWYASVGRKAVSTHRTTYVSAYGDGPVRFYMPSQTPSRSKQGQCFFSRLYRENYTDPAYEFGVLAIQFPCGDC
jgi:hypothetical protein